MANGKRRMAVMRRRFARDEGNGAAVHDPECHGTTEAVNRTSKRIR
jgi:hypothetical protein